MTARIGREALGARIGDRAKAGIGEIDVGGEPNLVEIVPDVERALNRRLHPERLARSRDVIRVFEPPNPPNSNKLSQVGREENADGIAASAVRNVPVNRGGHRLGAPTANIDEGLKTNAINRGAGRMKGLISRDRQEPLLQNQSGKKCQGFSNAFSADNTDETLFLGIKKGARSAFFYFVLLGPVHSVQWKVLMMLLQSFSVLLNVAEPSRHVRITAF